MPIYNMKNTKTKETREMVLSFADLDAFLEDNPDWEQGLSTPLIVSGVKSPLSRTDDGWKEVLGRVKKGSGRGNTINT